MRFVFMPKKIVIQYEIFVFFNLFISFVRLELCFYAKNSLLLKLSNQILKSHCFQLILVVRKAVVFCLFEFEFELNLKWIDSVRAYTSFLLAQELSTGLAPHWCFKLRLPEFKSVFLIEIIECSKKDFSFYWFFKLIYILGV